MQQSESDDRPDRASAGRDATTDQQVADNKPTPLNSVDILGPGKGPHPAPVHLDQKKTQQEKPPIGTAELLKDETLILHLRAESQDGKTHGDGELVIHPGDKDYGAIRSHIGEIHQGQLKFVSPWEETLSPPAGGKGDKPVKGDIAPPVDGGATAGGDTPKVDTPKVDAPKTDAPKSDSTTITPKSDTTPGDTTGSGAGGGAGTSPGDSTKPGDASAKAQAAVPDPPVVPPSQTFTSDVNNTYNAMTSQTRAIIATHGTKLVPTHHLTDAMPELKGQAPRGWPAGSTWDMVDGCWSSGKNEIIVAEERKSLTTGSWIPSGRTQEVVRHEAGHALDYTINMLSDHNDLKKAYDDDLAAMPTGDKNQLSYFLQSGAGGREETVAEGVADREGGATGGQTFHKDFSKTLKVINDTINSTGGGGTTVFTGPVQHIQGTGVPTTKP